MFWDKICNYNIQDLLATEGKGEFLASVRGWNKAVGSPGRISKAVCALFSFSSYSRCLLMGLVSLSSVYLILILTLTGDIAPGMG